MDSTFILILIVILGIRVALHFFDKSAIQSAATSKGWSNVQVIWAPFAPGWFFEKNERHYRVLYSSQDGQTHEVYCKNSMLGGIYWRDEESR